MLDHKIVGHFGVAAQRFQVKNKHIPHPDLLATLGVRSCLAGLDGFSR
jgi:hypothetical protein